MSISSGVYPCYENQFKIGAVGSQTLNTIADMESFSVSFNDGVEEWNTFEEHGWKSRMKTAKDMTISVSGSGNSSCPYSAYQK